MTESILYRSNDHRYGPIPPREALERFHVFEPVDSRFRSCSRLLQAIWRERRALGGGTYARSDGEIYALGSRLSRDAALAGFNYLTPEIAKLVRREIAYREKGALIEEERAWGNLLSSTALTFNLLGPLKLDRHLAKAVLKAAFGTEVAEVEGVYFETSPGRGDESYIGDYTALDALITYKDPKGCSGFIAIEVKYAEGQPTNSAPVKPCLTDLASRSAMFRDAGDETLTRPPLRQFFAEHMLCYAMVHERMLFDHGRFVVIAPTLNAEIGSAVASYASKLSDDHAQILPFGSISIEAIVSALHDCGAVSIAKALDERYLDFSPVYDLIDDWVPHRPTA